MSVFNSVGTPLVVLMVILMVGGAIFGTAVGDAGYLNPATSNAQAAQMNVETGHQQALFTEQERLAQVQTDAQIETIHRNQQIAEQQAQINLQYEQQLNERKLAAYEHRSQLINDLLSMLGISASITIILAIVFFLGSKAIVVLSSTNLQNLRKSSANNNPSLPTQPLNDLWRSPEFREQVIKIARNNEAAIRQAMLNQSIQALHNPVSMTKEQWEKLPRAE